MSYVWVSMKIALTTKLGDHVYNEVNCKEILNIEIGCNIYIGWLKYVNIINLCNNRMWTHDKVDRKSRVENLVLKWCTFLHK
jgi:hypothetical protein